MPEAIAAPSEAPAAAVAAPSTQPSAAPTSTMEAMDSTGMKDAFAELDSKSSAPAVHKAYDKPQQIAPPTEDPKPKTEPPKEPEKETKPVEVPSEKMAPKALREAYESLKSKHKSLEQEVQSLKTKPAEPPKETVDTKSWQDRITAAETRRQELEDEIRFHNYEKSTEYQEKYHQPYLKTAENASSRATQLKVSNPETGEARNFTAQEFWQIVQIGDEDAAIAAAEKVFGENSTKANFVIERRNEILAAWRSAENAKAEFRQKGSEREKITQEQMAQRSRQAMETFQQLNKEAAEKYPHWFQPEDGDDKGNELLENGFKLADSAISGENLPPEELIRARSALRNKAAGFDRMAYKLSNAQAQIKELQAQLSEFQKSVPGEGEQGREAAPAPKTWEQELEETAK